MAGLTVDSLSKLEPIDQVCFVPADQVHKVRTYLQVDEDAGKIVIDLTDALMPNYNRQESLCRQLHTLASSLYGVPAYDQALFSFLRKPGTDDTAILMRTSKNSGDLYLEATTTREPLEQFLENHTPIDRNCYLVHPEHVQTYVIDQDETVLDVTEPVTAAWHRDPSRSICFHLHEWFTMMHKDAVPNYEAMSSHYKFYTDNELGTMVVVLDGRHSKEN